MRLRRNRCWGIGRDDGGEGNRGGGRTLCEPPDDVPQELGGIIAVHVVAEHRNPHSGRDRHPPHGQVGELSKHFAHDAVLGQLEGVVGDEGEDVAAYMAGQGLQRAEPAVLRVGVVVVDGRATVIVVQHVLRVVAVVGLQRREGRRVARGLGRALGLAAPPSRRGWHRRAAAPSRAAADLARRSALCCGPGSLPRRLCRGGGAAARHAARLRHARPGRAGHRRGPARRSPVRAAQLAGPAGQQR